MENLIPFTSSDLAKITNHRSGEIKFGEKMLTVPKNTGATTFLTLCEAKYVLVGIPEDIGVRANLGRPGTHSAWASTLKSIAKTEKIEIRKWIIELFSILKENNIPLIIISASWIWVKSISYFLEERWLMSDNIKIISNDFLWDANWTAIAYKEPIIHSFNKWETVLKEFPSIYSEIKNRTNVILLWDSLWDTAMIDWFDFENLLKIWFLNYNENDLIESYKKIYDIVLTWDNDWEFITEILK